MGLFGGPDELMEEGDGRTSDNLDGGSFLSLFQMPVPQGNEAGPAWPRFRTPEEVG